MDNSILKKTNEQVEEMRALRLKGRDWSEIRTEMGLSWNQFYRRKKVFEKRYPDDGKIQASPEAESLKDEIAEMKAKVKSALKSLDFESGDSKEIRETTRISAYLIELLMKLIDKENALPSGNGNGMNDLSASDLTRQLEEIRKSREEINLQIKEAQGVG